MRRAAALAGALASSAPGLAAAGVPGCLALETARFNPGQQPEQVVAVHDRCASGYDFVGVECGFFAGEALVAAGVGAAANLAAGQTAYISVFARNAADATRATCRINLTD